MTPYSYEEEFIFFFESQFRLKKYEAPSIRVALSAYSRQSDFARTPIKGGKKKTYLFGGPHDQLEFAFQRGVQQQRERIERHPPLVTDAAARLLQVALFPNH